MSHCLYHALCAFLPHGTLVYSQCWFHVCVRCGEVGGEEEDRVAEVGYTEDVDTADETTV